MKIAPRLFISALQTWLNKQYVDRINYKLPGTLRKIGFLTKSYTAYTAIR